MNEQRAVIQQMVDALDHADELLGGNDTLVMNGAAAGRWLLEQPAPVQEKNQSPYPEYDRGFSNGWDRGFAAAQPAPNCTRSHPHENMDAMCELRTEIARLTNENARLKAQPVPVKTYHDGKPWPVAPKPWVGLTNNELQPIADEYRILFGGWVEDFARAIEAKLKEKNHDSP